MSAFRLYDRVKIDEVKHIADWNINVREREREIRLLAVAEDNTIIHNNEMPLLMGWMVNDTLYHPKTSTNYEQLILQDYENTKLG